MLCCIQVMDYSMLVCRGEFLTAAGLPPGDHQLHCLCSTRPEDEQGRAECFYFAFIDISQEFTRKKSAEQFAKVTHLLTCNIRSWQHSLAALTGSLATLTGSAAD